MFHLVRMILQVGKVIVVKIFRILGRCSGKKSGFLAFLVTASTLLYISGHHDIVGIFSHLTGAVGSLNTVIPSGYLGRIPRVHLVNSLTTVNYHQDSNEGNSVIPNEYGGGHGKIKVGREPRDGRLVEKVGVGDGGKKANDEGRVDMTQEPTPRPYLRVWEKGYRPPNGFMSKRAPTEPLRKCSCSNFTEDPALSIAKEELPLLDPTSNLSSWESLMRYHPNLPMQQMLNNSLKHCDLLPDLFSIHWTNVHWQRFEMKEDEGFYYLYSAFYDNRTKTADSGGVVRILALLQYDMQELAWCSLWYSGKPSPVASKVISAEYIDWQYPQDDRLKMYLLTCLAGHAEHPSTDAVPMAVSLVSVPCGNATNVLRVIGKSNNELPSYLLQPPPFNDRRSPYWKVGVCAPALFYYQDDFSLPMMEWLELLRAVGVSQVFLYTTRGVHPNINKVLKYYERQGFVELVDFQYPPPYPNEPLLRRMWVATKPHHSWSMENVYFSDCILRYKDRYRFLVRLDLDEMPVLLQHSSLPELIAHLVQINATSKELPPNYYIYWRYFNMDDTVASDTGKPVVSKVSKSPLPQHFKILRNRGALLKDNNRQHSNRKSIFNTGVTTAITSHRALSCTTDPCPEGLDVEKSTAFTGHFRSAEECRFCNAEPVPQLERYSSEVVKRVTAVSKEIGLLP